MLPPNETRCAGKLAEADCQRRNTCARYLTPPGRPMAWSACEEGDGFIHAATVSQTGGAGNPYAAPHGGVMDTQSVRSGGESA